ncbi:MAG: hypothetical protein AAGE90_16245 [Pseudomonadota bacterium]
MIMKVLKSAVAALAIGTAGAAEAKETVVGISPFGTAEEKLAEVKEVASHLLETLKPGETGWVVDAHSQALVAATTVSTEPKKSGTMQARMRADPKFFADLKRFADAARAAEGDHHPGQIDFPAFVRTIGTSFPAETERDLILFRVSPLTHDPREPGLSMAGGAVPDDAHIAAARATSVYGSADEAGLLQNYTVHWSTDGMGWSVSDRHAHFVQRFYALSVAKRGGMLATFSPDPQAALRNAKAGISAPIGSYTLKSDDAPTMILYGAAESATQTSAEMATQSIYARALSTRAPVHAELTDARDVEIAIRWQCDCDFDLAVRPADGETISYRNLETAFGRLFKDFTSSEDLDLGWETVSLPAVDLSTTTVAMNLFRGQPGAVVELRIAIGGETWGQRFTVTGNADGGDGFAATMRKGRPANAAWIVVDPKSLMEGV